MKTLEVFRRKFDSASLLKRSAFEDDTDQVITEPTLIMCDGVPIIAYDLLESEFLVGIKEACRKVKFSTGKRTLGLKSTSRIFGYRPRITIRQDFCSATSLDEFLPTTSRIVFSSLNPGRSANLSPLSSINGYILFRL